MSWVGAEKVRFLALAFLTLPKITRVIKAASRTLKQAAQQGAAPDRLQPCVSLVPRFTSGFRRRVSLVVLSLARGVSESDTFQSQMNEYKIWIEAEHWAEGEWNPSDDNSDVIVTMANGTRWFTTFFSYANISSLVEKFKQSGESLSGKYFWATDMLLVDEVSRPRIEEVVHHLIKENEFDQIFTQVESE